MMKLQTIWQYTYRLSLKSTLYVFNTLLITQWKSRDDKSASFPLHGSLIEGHSTFIINYSIKLEAVNYLPDFVSEVGQERARYYQEEIIRD